MTQSQSNPKPTMKDTRKSLGYAAANINQECKEDISDVMRHVDAVIDNIGNQIEIARNAYEIRKRLTEIIKKLDDQLEIGK